jgi:hypothetical protein
VWKWVISFASRFRRSSNCPAWIWTPTVKPIRQPLRWRSFSWGGGGGRGACRPTVVALQGRARAASVWRRMPEHSRCSVRCCCWLLRRTSAQLLRRARYLAGVLFVCACLTVAGLLNAVPVSVTAVPPFGMGDAVNRAEADPSTPVRSDGRFSCSATVKISFRCCILRCDEGPYCVDGS